jgi:hypothetical protein
MLEFFLAVALIVLVVVSLYAISWLTPRLLSRLRARPMSADRMNRLVHRACANLDQEYKDLLRR